MRHVECFLEDVALSGNWPRAQNVCVSGYEYVYNMCARRFAWQSNAYVIGARVRARR